MSRYPRGPDPASESPAQPHIRVMYCRLRGPSARRSELAGAASDNAGSPQCSPSRHALAVQMLVRGTPRWGQANPDSA